MIGNLTDQPELRFASSAAAVANFTVASTPHSYDCPGGTWRAGEPLFLRCTVWRQVAENAAESLTMGSREILAGRLCQRSYDTPAGEKRNVLDVAELGAAPALVGAAVPA